MSNESYTVLNDLAASLYSALYVDLPEIEYRWRSPGSQVETLRKRRPELRDVETFMFPQMWGSTALGFGGMGGAAMTSASTVVIASEHRNHCCVYFAGRLAYLVSRPNKTFWEDVAGHRMCSVGSHKKRYWNEDPVA